MPSCALAMSCLDCGWGTTFGETAEGAILEVIRVVCGLCRGNVLAQCHNGPSVLLSDHAAYLSYQHVIGRACPEGGDAGQKRVTRDTPLQDAQSLLVTWASHSAGFFF
jgi:hypothetical protein